jgi:hypothetical protein
MGMQYTVLGETLLKREEQLIPSERAILAQIIRISVGKQLLYQPELLFYSGPPSVAGLVSSIGGDGEHSYVYTWLFKREQDIFVPIGQRLLYAVTDVRWAGKDLSFRGSYWVDFCGVCDGPDASEELVVIPVKGLISASRLDVAFDGGEKERSSLLQELNEKKNQVTSLPSETVRRYTEAIKLLSGKSKTR